ncbi:hypothetical protein GBAR_LOCUS13752, partial [Geodia barretti]
QLSDTFDYYDGLVGRLLICSEQRWRTIPSNNWIYENSDTACFELGFDWGSMFYRWDDEQYTPVEWSGIPRYSKFSSAQKIKRCLLIQCDSF